MKNRKAPGLNGLPAEAYKLLDKDLKTKVHSLLVKYWIIGDYDTDGFHEVNLRLLEKGGDTSLPKNYRPIALLDVLSKILSSMITERLGSHMKFVGLAEQFGFSKDKGCMDASTVLKTTLQNMKNSNQDAYVLFVDIVKAFDSVNRDMLWSLLGKYGIPDSLIMVIRKLYTDIRIKSKIGKETFSFPSKSGVKQ